MALKEDYKDAVFAGLRKYKMLDNGDGTVSPVDMTEHETAGDKFGAKDVNAITKTVNATGEIIADDNDEFKPNQKYEIGRIVIYDNKTWRFKVDHEPGEWDERQVERTNILGEIAESKKQCNELTENSNWKQLLLAENIPATFTQYDVQWNECKELIFVLGFYGNVLETIVEPVSLFATHNGEGNRIIFGASDEVEIYASLSTSNDSMFIKNGGRSTNVLRIYGR